MKRLLALDLDGTCLDQYGQTTHELKVCLESIRDKIVLVYCTGRSVSSAGRVIHDAGLPESDYLVTDVGNCLYCKTATAYEPDSVYEAFNTTMWELISDELNWLLSDPQLPCYPQEGSMTRRLSFWAISEESAAKTANIFIKRLFHRGAVVRWDGPTQHGFWWIDILPPSSGKATAVHYIAYLENIRPADVMSIGDSCNDVDMLSLFPSAVPANASKRLLSELRRRGCSVLRAQEAGPEGTASAISDLFSRKSIDANKKPLPASEVARLEHLRKIIPLTPFLNLSETLSPWPHQLHNWGLKEPPRRGLKFRTWRESKAFLSQGRNWWWENASTDKKDLIIRRYGAIPVRFLVEKLDDYIKKEWDATLLGAMVSGSYLYGESDLGPANDLDLVLLLWGLKKDAAVVGLEIEVPGLRSAFRSNDTNLKHDRIGLGLIDCQYLTWMISSQDTFSPEFLQLAASMAGSGLPLFGWYIDSDPMPCFDLLCQASILIQDGYRMLDDFKEDHTTKIIRRCAETVCVLNLAAKRLSLKVVDDYDLIPSIHASLKDLRKYLFNCRQKTAQMFFNLAKAAMHSQPASEVVYD